jgi:ADP-ribose pyrophosphatase YjhB (NUDIX family)
MPISPYIRQLRAHVGPMRLLLPSVSAHVFDAAGRLLLVQQRDSRVWSTPGGALEPDERPADAVVRETWEETGLYVQPEALAGAYGGPEFVVRYPNGDEVQYAIMAFRCRVISGELRADGEETMAVRYWSAAELATLPTPPWLQTIRALIFDGADASSALAVTWNPGRGPANGR